MPFDTLSEVTAIQQIAEGTFRMILEAPEIAREAMPGQFAMVGFNSPLFDPFLRRPLSFSSAEFGRVEFIVRVVGWGTALLSDLISGEQIPILGPLGTPFPRPEGGAILVGGGVGVAPLLFAGARWKNPILLCTLPNTLSRFLFFLMPD